MYWTNSYTWTKRKSYMPPKPSFSAQKDSACLYYLFLKKLLFLVMSFAIKLFLKLNKTLYISTLPNHEDSNWHTTTNFHLQKYPKELNNTFILAQECERWLKLRLYNSSRPPTELPFEFSYSAVGLWI